MTLEAARNGAGLPDMSVSVRQVFCIDTDLEVPAYSQSDAHVPDIDSDYQFNPEVTLAILAGFKHNRRVMIQGYHGTGKSTHIEQVAARLNWPCMRINNWAWSTGQSRRVECQVRIRNHEVQIVVHDIAEALAARARSKRIIETEQPRFRLGELDFAALAGELLAEA